MSDKDFDWLKVRLAEPTSCQPEWVHVLELYDVLEVLPAQGIEAEALERHYRSEHERMNVATMGGFALKPSEVMIRGGAVGGVNWLIKQGYDVAEARSAIAKAMQIDRTSVVYWCRQAAHKPVPSGNYKLGLPFAAQQMQESLGDLYNRLHNQLGPNAVAEIIKQVFAPKS